MTKKLKVTVSTGWANGNHVDYWDLPDNWDEMTEERKESYKYDCAIDFLNECCESYAEEVDEEEE